MPFLSSRPFRKKNTFISRRFKRGRSLF